MLVRCMSKLETGRFEGLFVFLFIWLQASSVVEAQNPLESGTFSLSAQGLADPSIARITPSELSVQDSTGSVTRYQRAPRYDTTDQLLLGYSSRQAQQVIRWPANNSGRMQIGTLQNGQVQFAWSKMNIVASQQIPPSNPSADVLPPGLEDVDLLGRLRNNQGQGATSGYAGNLLNLPQMTAMSLASGDINERQFLSMQGGNQLGFVNQATGVDAAWYIAPVSTNVVRLQQRFQNDWFAIGLGNVPNANLMHTRLGNRRLGGATGSLPLSLLPIHNGADQLWRIQNMSGGGYCFENVMVQGMGLTCVPNQGLFLQPITYNPWQVWWPQTPTFVLPQPQFRTTQHQVVPNQPLGSTTVQIVNSHSDTLLVLVADRRNPQQLQKLRIPSRGSERIQLDRDAGATIIETVETLDAFGNWQQQQFKTAIPPSVLYDISVYEEFLQSIAIDRTGKSPNPIEDINYQPRAVGFFLVPPGDDLPAQAEIDAYRIADDAHNPGAVRKLSQRDLERKSAAPATDPLKDLLKQFQKQRGAF